VTCIGMAVEVGFCERNVGVNAETLKLLIAVNVTANDSTLMR